ncbi:hypothetical protein H9L19_06280 [Weissella diestrammenae]|uniref:Uncharacterized protein n=1 Tax=Weissella diestrammenae TaxID=1162633 RepID=A0A7G9T4G8_9LACO|nr:hypothetical protein [Weissella diestrammenae]MCM0583530.1 hypothetical protein [Weissella diestrammenae]QNN74993.1 hypothetical protein H9L19_06280 [Weissella diestrammenae]
MNEQMITVSDDFFTPAQLSEQIKAINTSDQSNLDKKDEVNKIITALSRFKKAAQTEFNRQIQPALDLEK